MDFFAQSFTVNVFHGDEMHAFALADLIDVRDVRMIERGRGLRFANKTFHAITVRNNVGRQNLQCDFTIEFRILSQIHLAHSAGAELRADFVTAEFCA